MAASGALVVEGDPAGGMQPVSLPVVDGDEVGVGLGRAVRRTGCDSRALVLGRCGVPEHLRGGRLVEADVGINDADRLQEPGDPERGDVAGEDRLSEACGDVGLGGQVVHLVRTMGAERGDEGAFVEQVAGLDRQSILDVGDALERHRGTASGEPDDLVPLVEEQLREVAAVLAGDAGDQRPLGRGHVLGCTPPSRGRAAPSPSRSLKLWSQLAAAGTEVQDAAELCRADRRISAPC